MSYSGHRWPGMSSPRRTSRSRRTREWRDGKVGPFSHGFVSRDRRGANGAVAMPVLGESRARVEAETHAGSSSLARRAAGRSVGRRLGWAGPPPGYQVVDEHVRSCPSFPPRRPRGSCGYCAPRSRPCSRASGRPRTERERPRRGGGRCVGGWNTGAGAGPGEDERRARPVHAGGVSLVGGGSSSARADDTRRLCAKDGASALPGRTAFELVS